MSRRAAVVLALAGGVALIVAAPAPASAHPLGNFTVNTSAAIVIASETIGVDYVVDMAEIPSFREQREMDIDGDGTIAPEEETAYETSTCRDLADALDVVVDGKRVDLLPRSVPVGTFADGAGGLPTFRLACAYAASLDPAIAEGAQVTVSYEDRNHPEALGWREVSAAGDGTTLTRSDVPSTSSTDMLRSYPEGELPLDVRSASLVVTGGGSRLAPAAPSGTATGRGPGTGLLASLVGRPDVSPASITVLLLLAFGVGAVHALGPGHGKTLIGAYLVGGSGSLRDAVGVGIAVSLMHSVAVLALGVVVVTAERLAAPERVYPWLGVVAGAIAVVLGLSLLHHRLGVRAEEARNGGAHDGRSHIGLATHAHAHVSPHVHGPRSRRGLVALALSGGALPSPTALVVFLATVPLGRATLGVAVIGAFSAGLATALAGVGVLALRARDVADRRLPSGLVRAVPLASAATIVAMGAFLALRGVSQL